MAHFKMRAGTLVLGFIIVITMCILFSSSAVAATQGEYVVTLAARLGFGGDLTAEAAAAALKRVDIVPEEGWQIGLDVTCELVAEVQILVIKAAQRGLIRYDAEDIPLLMASLSDELDVCSPTTVVVYPAVAVTPPPINAPLVGETSPTR